MTTPSRPPDDLPRDSAFDDAWRALSREEPSAALDAAVRAAARREVGAGPQTAAARASRGAGAAKPMNWWRPLAVAATIGAIAVGLMQLVTPEHVGAPSHDGAIVSDMPAADAVRQTESAKKQTAASASNETAAPEEKARTTTLPVAPAGSAVDRKEAQLQSRESVAPPATPAPHDELAQSNARKDVIPERKRDATSSGAPATVAPAIPAPKRIDEPANAPPPQAAPMRAAEPFPAERAKREEAAPAREAMTDTASARAPAAPATPAAAGSGGATSAPEAATDKALAGKPAADYSAASLAKLKTAPVRVASEQGMVGANAAQGQREQDAQTPPRAPSAMQAAPTSALDARVAEHAKLAVPDWITLIRRLIAEKNYIAADKELAAFRAAHPDADRVLPPDLRDWKAPR